MATQRFQESSGDGVRCELVIDRLGRDGDGMAGDVRVAFALPGEQVRGVVAGRRMAEAEVLKAAAGRVTPPCPHFGACGGCALQHLGDAGLAAWKAETIERALAAHGLAAALRPVAVSPAGSRRRAVLTGRRTRKTVVLGFHGRRSETVVGIETCLVLRPEIVAALPVLRALVRLAASRQAAVRLTVTAGPAGLDVDIAGARPDDAGQRAALAGAAAADVVARLALGGEPLVVHRPPLQPLGRARVVPPPGAFLQATAEGEAALVAAVREIVGPQARRVADLYAGCGTFALPLAEGAEVHAVEGSGAMLAALDAGWRATPGLRRVRTETRDLARRPLLAGELAGLDAVVLDPPRAGAEAQCRALAASAVPVIASVSCDPASFARDAAILVAGGYRLDWVLPVDQFRWSGHVELVGRFAR